MTIVADPAGITWLELPIAGARCERVDAAANRQCILAAARRLFLERGADGVSMDAVAAEAGVGKGTLFRRFGDRAGLTEALLDDEVRTFQNAFLHGPPPLGPGASPAERIVAFLDALLAMLDRNLDLVLAADRSLPVAPSQPGRRDVLALHLRVLLDDVELPAGADPDVVADMLLGACSAKVIRHQRRAREVDLETVQASARALLGGLVPSLVPVTSVANPEHEHDQRSRHPAPVGLDPLG